MLVIIDSMNQYIVGSSCIGCQFIGTLKRDMIATITHYRDDVIAIGRYADVTIISQLTSNVQTITNKWFACKRFDVLLR